MSKKHFVHKYKWSHDKKRKKFLNLEKRGLVKRLETRYDGWLYEETSSSKDVVLSTPSKAC